jgi:hypothetical protein
MVWLARETRLRRAVGRCFEPLGDCHEDGWATKVAPTRSKADPSTTLRAGTASAEGQWAQADFATVRSGLSRRLLLQNRLKTLANRPACHPERRVSRPERRFFASLPRNLSCHPEPFGQLSSLDSATPSGAELREGSPLWRGRFFVAQTAPQNDNKSF